jgi:hypothetical protein
MVTEILGNPRMLDEQVLAAEIPTIGKPASSATMNDYASVPKPKTLRESVNQDSGLSKRNSVLLAIAASFVALVFGIGWGNNLGKSSQRELLSERENNRSQVTVLTDLLIADRAARQARTLCSLYPDQPMSILSQAQQAAEAQKLQALAMQTAALDAYKRALENALINSTNDCFGHFGLAGTNRRVGPKRIGHFSSCIRTTHPNQAGRRELTFSRPTTTWRGRIAVT